MITFLCCGLNKENMKKSELRQMIREEISILTSSEQNKVKKLIKQLNTFSSTDIPDPIVKKEIKVLIDLLNDLLQ